MNRQRTVIMGFVLICTVVGALFGYTLAPTTHRYSAGAKVVLLPAADLPASEASNFWEVLTRGQVSRMAAIIYDDQRWLSSAARAANVPQDQLSLSASALQDTTMVVVTVTANSPMAAEAALNDVLTVATAEVTSLVVPYKVKVLWPPPDSGWPIPEPGRMQVAAAGGLGGLLVGIGLPWLRHVRRRGSRSAVATPLADEVQ